MEAFLSTMDQMAFLFLCMLIGFVLHKMHILDENADVLISRLENDVFVPALIINSFMTYCTVENLAANASALLYCVLFLGISIVIGFLLAPRFAKDRTEEGIYRYSFSVTNFGFMGNSLVQGLLGEAALFRYLIFTIPGNVFTYSAGIIWLTAGQKKFSPKMLLNTTFISMVIGMLLGLGQFQLPSFMMKTIDACASCFSPLAMILTGFVIAKFDIAKLFRQVKVYLIAVIRVVIMPLAYLGISYLLHMPQDIRVLMIFFSAMPLGLNTIVFPAAYGGDETIGASMAVISSILGIVSVPLILSLVL